MCMCVSRVSSMHKSAVPTEVRHRILVALLAWVLELNLGSLQEQYMLLTAEPALQTKRDLL